MSKIDRAINIYQAYSLAKISALNKQSLIAQHAQCEHIRKLEKTLQRELQSINRTNQKILENQIKDAKKAENIKYFRLIAHNCKEGISLIQRQADPILSLFLLELFEAPFRLVLQEAKDNLEDISDLDYCQNWINQLSLTKQRLSISEQDYISSPFHLMLIENKPYLDEIKRLEDMKVHLTKEIGNVPKPNFKTIPTEKEFKSSCGLTISKILVVFCVIMFVLNFITDSHNFLASITSLIIVFIITPLAIWGVIQYFTNKKAKKYTEFVNQLKAHNALLQSEYDIKIQSLQMQLLDVENHISECNCNHPYIIAKDKSTKYFNDWHKLLTDVQSYLPSLSGETGNKSVDNKIERDAMFNDCARFIVKQSTASTSSLQRRFSIGYNKAGKIMDQLEAAGIVGPAQGANPRVVLMDATTLESIL